MVRSEFDGDEDSRLKAGALSAISDAEFVESMVHVKAALDRLGGQVEIAALREKVNAKGEPVDDKDTGDYVTRGYVFHYEAHTDLLRRPEEPDTKRAEIPLQFGDDLDEELDADSPGTDSE